MMEIVDLEKAEIQVIKEIRSLPFGNVLVIIRGGRIRRMESTKSTMLEEETVPSKVGQVTMTRSILPN
jgi:hypothetical protein